MLVVTAASLRIYPQQKFDGIDRYSIYLSTRANEKCSYFTQLAI